MKVKTILHGITALCSALVFVFFALPYYTTTTTIAEEYKIVAGEYGLVSGTTSYNGYDFISNAFQNPESTATGVFGVIIALITLIVAGIAFITAVVAILGDTGVIKNERVVSVVEWIAFAVMVVLAIACVLNLVGNFVVFGNDVQNKVDSVNGLGIATMSASAGYTLSILTLICGLGAIGTTTFAKFKKEN